MTDIYQRAKAYADSTYEEFQDRVKNAQLNCKHKMETFMNGQGAGEQCVVCGYEEYYD